MITSVVHARMTGQGVDNPSLTGSNEMVTINVYFANANSANEQKNNEVTAPTIVVNTLLLEILNCR